jgi:hypothetical protein
MAGYNPMDYTDFNEFQYSPVISNRAPTTRDKNYEIGTLWIDKALNDAYILTSVVSNVASWINAGGGSGSFSALTVNPGNTTITAGNLVVTAGSVTFGAMGVGVLFSSAAGAITSSAGTNGQLVIGRTGLAPVWGTLTAGAGIGIVEGVGTITISAPGATAVSYVTDVAGPVVPDGTGAVNVVGGTNITSDGTVANTITLNLDDSVVLVGKLTAGNDLEMSTGTCLINSDDNAANAIYLHANAGVNETINIFSDQGTDVASVWIHSDVGGLTLASGLASADAINITASDAAGGIDIDAGTAGTIIANANGPFTVTTGTGAISIGADAAAHDVTLGGTTGASSLTLQAGTGAVTVTAGGVLDINAVGLVTLDSTGGRIDIGAGADAFNINLGTGAAARTVTIGNSTGASSVIVDVGTGNLDLGVSATAHTCRLGSTTGASATTIQGGTGGIAINAAGIVTMLPATDSQAAAAVTINANVGVGTFTGITTAAGSSQDFTINNSICTATSAILCTLANKGANDAQMTVQRVLPGAGSFVVTAKNNGAAALNGDVIITFWIIKAS